jgi:hypothetical protein
MRSGPGAFPLDVTASNPGAWRVTSAATGGAAPSGSAAAAAQPLFFAVLGFDAVTGTHLLKRVGTDSSSTGCSSSSSGAAGVSKAGSSSATSGADVIDYIQVCLVHTVATVLAQCGTRLN